MMRRSFYLATVFWLCTCIAGVFAQDRQAGGRTEGRPVTSPPPARKAATGDVLRRWRQLEARQKEILRRKLELWKKLSPEERRRIQANFKRFQQLPPDKQEELKKQSERFRQLPPAKREELLEHYKQWMSLSQEMRNLLRQTLALLKQLLPEEYERLKASPPAQRRSRARALRAKLKVLLNLPLKRTGELMKLPPRERRAAIRKLMRQALKQGAKDSRPRQERKAR